MVEEPRHNDSGFTMVEVLVALVVMAMTLTTLLGLQSAVIDRSIQDARRISAMLIARKILADIEASPANYDFQNKTGPIGDFLNEDELSDSELKSAEGFEGNLAIEQWGIPENPEALRKITFTIIWGDSILEKFSATYFTVNDKEEVV